jgi:hypothetical protein
LLWQFFTTPHPRYRYLEAISAAGRLVAAFPLDRFPEVTSNSLAGISSAHVVAFAVFLALAVGLAVAGTLAGDRFAQSLGLLVAVAAVAMVLSAREVIGPLYGYLLMWTTTISLSLAIGWVALAGRLDLWDRLPGPARIAAAGLAALAVAALAWVQLWQIHQLPPLGPVDPNTPAAWRATEAALAGQPKDPVLLQVDQLEEWPMAAGVALQLDKEGRPARVATRWVFIFGVDSQATGEEPEILSFVPGAQAGAYAAAHPDALLLTSSNEAAVFLRPNTSGESG